MESTFTPSTDCDNAPSVLAPVSGRLLPSSRPKLVNRAQSLLVTSLTSMGNQVGNNHAAALYELLDTFATHCTGETQGRLAFGLPTGIGKTSAVLAFLVALYELGHAVPVSVAASRVSALCDLKKKLEAAGVPGRLIGLKHSVHDAEYPSTGNEEFLFQLVTHARVRGGTDFELFGTYQGTPRALCIYDETLLRADSFAFNERLLRQSLGWISPVAEDAQDSELNAALAYLRDCSHTIKGCLDKLREAGDTHANGLPIELPRREEVTLKGWADALRRHGRRANVVEDLIQLLEVSQEHLQVLKGAQGDGIVCVREAVPLALRNVVVLDASGPIRELARMDPTVTHVESFKQQDLKDWSAVEVHQFLAAGGRSSIEASFSAERKEVSALSKEVMGICRAESEGDPEKSCLVFSFMKRGTLDVIERIKEDFRRTSMDPDATTSSGKRRFEFLTWGRHEGENGFEHCTAVILAGIIHRSHLDIAAAIKGQHGHLAQPTPHDLVRQVLESEVAHAVMQAASRGSCRRLVSGKAEPMKLFLVHRHLGLKSVLDPVMPGAQWHYPEPKHLKKAMEEGKTSRMLRIIIDHAHSLPCEVNKLSSRALKVAIAVKRGQGDSHAFSRAMQALDGMTHGWMLVGRSLVRYEKPNPFLTAEMAST